ncbi:hypothetical protein [Fulvivirga ligni]|uniref:hypothetical protein n=1 Tax=Fulvivirga ligni TaxID=2904246 RepID=UPI001F2B7CC1|nr:hypothetical protein [Fulvivirga ligni]UII19146.1 hypothetical protein LVD16_14975 [Fulvivirga ligni]
MKKLLFLLTFLISTAGFSQDLRQYIPADAVMVGSIHGDELFKPQVIQRLHDITHLKKAFEKLSKSLAYEINSLESIGVDIHKSGYFYMAVTDSILYYNFILPLNKSQIITDLMKDDEELAKSGNYSTKKMGGTTYITWDEQKLIISSGSYIDSYFYGYDFSGVEGKVEQAEEAAAEAVVAEVYGEEAANAQPPFMFNYPLQLYLNQYNEFQGEFIEKINEGLTAESLEALEAKSKEIGTAALEVDSISKPDPDNLDQFLKAKNDALKKAITTIESEELREKASSIAKNATFFSDSFSIKENKYLSNLDYKDYYNEKKYLEKQWILNYTERAFYPSGNSILNNKKYLTQVKEGAVLNFWLGNMGALMKTMNDGASFNPIMNMYSKINMNYGEMSCNLMLNEDAANWNFDVTLKEDLAKAYKEATDQKINKKFFKYINEDELLGYLAYNINVEKALKAYPDIISEQYKGIAGVSDAEMSLATDLFSLMLDEEAIGDLIKGDLLFLVSGVGEKEVTYTDYEYDEDYNFKEVTKTKKEPLPEFLVMASTESPDFTGKLIGYMAEKHLITPTTAGFYKVELPKRDMPMDLFFMIKDGIFFMSTSEKDMNAIVTNSFKTKVSKKHKKIIKTGNYTVYFKSKALFEDFSPEKMAPGESEFRNKLDYAQENATDFYIRSERIKNNMIHSEIVMEVPEGHVDATTYLIDLIDHLSR